MDYVIGRVTEKEADALWDALNKAAAAAADIVINDVTHAMQEFNIKPKRLKKEKEKALKEESSEDPGKDTASPESVKSDD